MASSEVTTVAAMEKRLRLIFIGYRLIGVLGVLAFFPIAPTVMYLGKASVMSNFDASMGQPVTPVGIPFGFVIPLIVALVLFIAGSLLALQHWTLLPKYVELAAELGGFDPKLHARALKSRKILFGGLIFGGLAIIPVAKMLFQVVTL